MHLQKRFCRVAFGCFIGLEAAAPCVLYHRWLANPRLHSTEYCSSVCLIACCFLAFGRVELTSHTKFGWLLSIWPSAEWNVALFVVCSFARQRERAHNVFPSFCFLALSKCTSFKRIWYHTSFPVVRAASSLGADYDRLVAGGMLVAEGGRA